MKKIRYNNKNERENIIQQKLTEDMIMIEEWNLFDGNYLLFAEKVPENLTVEERLEKMEKRVAALELEQQPKEKT